MDLIKIAEQAFAAENPVEHPSFNTGDTVSVHYKIIEGNKERIQVFRGVVIQIKGTGPPKPLPSGKCPETSVLKEFSPSNLRLSKKLK